jgi:hypothetical protein
MGDSVARVCFQIRDVILSGAKDPSGFRPLGRENDNPIGFFAAFRMTDFGSLRGLKTLPRV